jgi:Protein of unknown function (DUF3112)
MARIMANILRISWACKPKNISLAIAAQIFVAAGVVILFIINLIFAQRLLRAAHPNVGWHKAASLAFKVWYAAIVVMLIFLISFTVRLFYVTDLNKKHQTAIVQRVGGVFYTITAFLPIPLTLISLSIPGSTKVQKFGSGRYRSKIFILLLCSAILTLGAGFRTGGSFYAVPKTESPWFYSKACFYIFNFSIEFTVVLLYALLRVDRRFHVPDGAHGPGSYVPDDKPIRRVNTEEEVFDDEPALTDDTTAGSTAGKDEHPGLLDEKRRESNEGSKDSKEPVGLAGTDTNV